MTVRRRPRLALSRVAAVVPILLGGGAVYARWFDTVEPTARYAVSTPLIPGLTGAVSCDTLVATVRLTWTSVVPTPAPSGYRVVVQNGSGAWVTVSGQGALAGTTTTVSAGQLNGLISVLSSVRLAVVPYYGDYQAAPTRYVLVNLTGLGPLGVVVCAGAGTLSVGATPLGAGLSTPTSTTTTVAAGSMSTTDPAPQTSPTSAVSLPGSAVPTAVAAPSSSGPPTTQPDPTTPDPTTVPAPEPTVGDIEVPPTSSVVPATALGPPSPSTEPTSSTTSSTA